MLKRTIFAALALFTAPLFTLPAIAASGPSADADLERDFAQTVHPFVDKYCVSCHSGEKPKGHFDLAPYKDMAAVVRDHDNWSLVLEKLTEKEMPPKKAEEHPTDEARQQVIAWIQAVGRNEAAKNAGDPGVVLARRLNNAEYNYTIRDLTGVDIQPAREFPVDPANPAGFDNTGESLAMSPALLQKYLQAARQVASHLVLKPDSLAFAPHPMLVETDRDKYCVSQIIDFYNQQNTDYSDYFLTAWRFKHRTALGSSDVSLAALAAESRVSSKYLATVWQMLEETSEEVGPGAMLQSMWRKLPAPPAESEARAGCDAMRDWVVALRAKLEPRFPNLSAGRGLGASSQPFLMWKNRQYASHRMTYDRAALQVEGQAGATASQPSAEPGADNEFGPGATRPVNNKPGDPDLVVPAGQRERYEAAFARFCAVFPDAFYVSERGRNYLDKTKDRGRLLSAGFHNLMGYFRDDQPLYELVLDDRQQVELDALWRELDFVALATHRTFVQFFLNEAREARQTARNADAPEDAQPEDSQITSDAMVAKVAESYLTRARASSNAVAIHAVEDHFDFVNGTLRWVEKAKVDAEPHHLKAIEKFAERAYRRPLSPAEREDLSTFYRSLRDESGLPHEEAMRDLVVGILMMPDFCYRIDLVDTAQMPSSTPSTGPAARPLSDYALASRLSYFLWSSMPDEQLLARAAAGELHQPEVLAAEARRMLQDDRVRGLALEFGGNWLDFRRFDELNTVDRERFPAFNNELRRAMFEEPVRFMLDAFQENRSVLDFLYARHTFVNPILAKHYGMPEVAAETDEWVRVEDADHHGRGGLLPMGAFLTQNAPGLRTSPVKRGYWVVRRVLGEHIPAPPAAVPELPRDEAKMDLPLREMLARHREDPSCASCHARFDSFGLVLEGYGPVGEKRTTDLAGRPVDASAPFPGGTEATGLEGLREYVRQHRQEDFTDNLCRKLLAYALNRSLILSDEPTIQSMREKLASDDYRFASIVESIVTSPQFLTKRPPEHIAAN